MFEHKSHPLLPRYAFYGRVARSVAIAFGIVALSLTLGTLGYHNYGELAWIDALLNASMILSGMGPVDRMTTTTAKLFASFFALYSGTAFVATIAVVLAPIVHRFMHKFHLDDDERT